MFFFDGLFSFANSWTVSMAKKSNDNVLFFGQLYLKDLLLTLYLYLTLPTYPISCYYAFFFII